MGQPVSRVGDIGIGICYAHAHPLQYTTTFVTGIDDGLTDDLVTCIVGTIGISSCGHPTVALTGSTISTGDNEPIHRVGDTGANFGPYTSITGSSDFFSD